MKHQIELTPGAYEATKHILDSADEPKVVPPTASVTTAPFVRAMPTGSFPAEAICDRTTEAEAEAIRRAIRPHLPADSMLLSADRIETDMTVPANFSGSLTVNDLRAIVRAQQKAIEALQERLKYAVVTGAAERKERE